MPASLRKLPGEKPQAQLRLLTTEDVVIARDMRTGEAAVLVELDFDQLDELHALIADFLRVNQP